MRFAKETLRKFVRFTKHHSAPQEVEMLRNMIKTVTMLTLLVTISLVAAVVSAKAQGSRTERATVPFDFNVGDSEMAAGRYQFKPMNELGNAVSVRGTESAQSAIKLTNNLVRVDPAPESKLVFNRYGNKYFLSEIWIAGERTGRQIRKTKAEKAIVRELTASRQMRERVEIALAAR